MRHRFSAPGESHCSNEVVLYQKDESRSEDVVFVPDHGGWDIHVPEGCCVSCEGLP